MVGYAGLGLEVGLGTRIAGSHIIQTHFPVRWTCGHPTTLLHWPPFDL